MGAVAFLDTGPDALLGKAPHLLAQQLLIVAQPEARAAAEGSASGSGCRGGGSGGGFARWYVVVARTDPAAGKRGMTAFVVPADAPGFAVGQPEEKLGLRASRTAPIYFNDCRIPAENVLGIPGQGFKIALATLDHSRIGIAAQSVGIHQRALELAVAYARERVQFGVPIVRHQAVRFRIAEMATTLAASISVDMSAR